MTDRLFVFDTGPLLCFGGFPGGARLLASRYRGQAWTTGDVDRELRGLRRSPNPIIADAADRCVQKFNWIERRRFAEADDLETLDALRARLGTFQRGERIVPKSNRADFGECSVLLLAKHLTSAGSHVVVVINEDPARRLAWSLDIASVCFAEVLKAMCIHGTLTAAAAFAGCQKLKRGFVDVGDIVESPKYFQEAPAA